MAAYNFAPNEALVYKEAGVAHGGTFASYSAELLLTSENLVLIRKGIFGTNKGVLVFPLSQVKVFNNVAQAIAGKDSRGTPSLEVHFLQGVETFGFDRKKKAIAWAVRINEVITGGAPGFGTANASTTEKVADALAGTVGTFKAAFDRRAGAPAPAAAGACTSCGAAVSGMAGQVAVCGYCQSPNQL